MTPAPLAPQACAAAVSAAVADVFTVLEDWRDRVAAAVPLTTTTELDALVETLVVPALLGEAEPAAHRDAAQHGTAPHGAAQHGAAPHGTAPHGAPALLVGAGFIATADYRPGRPAHFAWWLGPLASNPLLGTTLSPTRLDLAARVHTEYLRDFRGLEWYRVPEATGRAHVTGPYVDHLCTFDFIVTLTLPVQVDGGTVGVIGADVSVTRLEQALLPVLLGLSAPAALVNAVGRVMISTEATLAAGDIVPNPGHPLTGYDRVPCPGIPFDVIVRRPPE
ncbi:MULTISPECIES: PDC sensor domain-containing protein [unclassified Cryobacterium]|uniref:cache domain-containing protein n=1 Tax=unclassified Cryobacterium TaxID=2649013 RepID=UPI00106C531E|nr:MULTISPECIES: PDC sensor domain-containing protein [unclassified Cryobacterium]TFB98260.1 hypothetical protein E3O39_05160 [Cryobacterium sp. MDB2-A-1]TFC13683.1 hypothetical protein E3O35_04955 [Cryobacterium sp. MDB2-A-2]TFC23749.1 hypothetical protein E3O51_00415 [Cryobacterium sp. MDB2-10]